ncbi:MAG: transcriptional coactivator p15/PC4 family protein [Candidatus Gastranaerophilaceae bacterium]
MADEGTMLATIARSATEQLQIAIKTYKGKSYLDLRIFYTTNDGQTWLPTKKGVTIAPDALMTLKDAVDKAMEELLSSEEADV